MNKGSSARLYRSNPILDGLEKRKLHRGLLARWDALEKQAHTGMVFYELSVKPSRQSSNQTSNS